MALKTHFFTLKSKFSYYIILALEGLAWNRQHLLAFKIVPEKKILPVDDASGRNIFSEI
jgi:hypothetical protein